MKKEKNVMKKILASLLTASLLVSLSCTVMAETPLEKIQAAGKIKVGTEATYPPYEYLDDNAEMVGCDIWLAKQIAEAIGVELEMVDMGFDGIIPAVASGQIDMGLAAFTVTPERAEVIDFSNQYEVSRQLLIVKAGNASVYADKESLSGLKVGAQLGTIQSNLVESALPDCELFELPTYPELGLETINGNIAGFVVDSAVGESMVAASNGDLEVSEFEFTAEEASFGKAAVLKKESADLLDAVNEVIDRVVEDGSYQAAYDEAVAASGVEEAEE